MTARTIALIGSTGEMGRAVATCKADEEIIVPVSRTLPISALADMMQNQSIDVMIDFSTPFVAMEAARVAAKNKIPFVSGTTGLSDEDFAELKQLAEEIPLLHAANFSIGVATLKRVVRQVAEIMPEAAIEIVEAHHRRKVDAPSGTALELAKTAAQAKNLAFDDVAQYGRQGETGPRPADQIGLHSIRGGDIVGEHTVYFINDFDRLELKHVASDRRLFALGALRAARAIIGHKPGYLSFDELIFSKQD